MAYLSNHNNIYHREKVFTSFFEFKMMEIVFYVVILSTVVSNIQTQIVTGIPETELMDSNITCVNVSNAEFTCLNGGVCKMPNNDLPRFCQCETPYYSGAACEILNLQIASYKVMATGIFFNWTRELYPLDNYLSLYAKTPLRGDSVIYSTNVNMIFSNSSEYKSSIVINGLEPNQMEYILCVIHRDQLGGNVVRTMVANGGDSNTVGVINATYMMTNKLMQVENLNCGILITPFDRFGPYHLVAIIIGVALPTVAIILIFIRGVVNCRNNPKRENVLTKVVGNITFLRSVSTINRKKEPESPDQPRVDTI